MNIAPYIIAIVSVLPCLLVIAAPVTDSPIELNTEYPTDEVTNIVTYAPVVIEPEATIPPEFVGRRDNIALEALPVQQKISDWGDQHQEPPQQKAPLVRVKRNFLPPVFSKIFLAKKFFVHQLLKVFTGFGIGIRPPFFG